MLWEEGVWDGDEKGVMGGGGGGGGAGGKDLLSCSSKVDAEDVEMTHLLGVMGKLQALVYDNLLSTTAVFSYTIGSRKLTSSFLLVLKQ